MNLKDGLLKVIEEGEVYKIYEHTYKQLSDDFASPDREKLNDLITEQIFSLLSLAPKSSNYSQLIVVKGKNWEENDSGEWQEHYFYDASVMSLDASSDETYALECVDWKDVIGVEINQNSILNYTLPVVLAEILFELSFQGFEYRKCRENQEKFWREIDESIKDIEAGRTIPMEKIEEDFGVESESDKQKEIRQEKIADERKFYEEELRKILEG